MKLPANAVEQILKSGSNATFQGYVYNFSIAIPQVPVFVISLALPDSNNVYHDYTYIVTGGSVKQAEYTSPSGNVVSGVQISRLENLIDDKGITVVGSDVVGIMQNTMSTISAPQSSLGSRFVYTQFYDNFIRLYVLSPNAIFIMDFDYSFNLVKTRQINLQAPLDVAYVFDKYIIGISGSTLYIMYFNPDGTGYPVTLRTYNLDSPLASYYGLPSFFASSVSRTLVFLAITQSFTYYGTYNIDTGQINVVPSPVLPLTNTILPNGCVYGTDIFFIGLGSGGIQGQQQPYLYKINFATNAIEFSTPNFANSVSFTVGSATINLNNTILLSNCYVAVIKSAKYNIDAIDSKNNGLVLDIDIYRIVSDDTYYVHITDYHVDENYITVKGYVTDWNGNPVPNVTVYLAHAISLQGESSFDDMTFASTQTDQNGTFSFSVQNPGLVNPILRVIVAKPTSNTVIGSPVASVA